MMLNKLKLIESTLHDRLHEPDLWESMVIDYEKPHVDRVWMKVLEGRLFLHKIHPCTAQEAFYHPHPWPSAVHILPTDNGSVYRMGIWRANKGEAIDYDSEEFVNKTIDTCTLEMKGDVYYQMIDTHGLHWVQPINAPVYTLMYTDKPWPKDQRCAPKVEPKAPQAPMNNAQKLEHLAHFRELLKKSKLK